MYDLLFRAVRIIDGTGRAAFTGDVAVKDGRIVKVGRLPAQESAVREIEAAGLTLIPGMIDCHSHYDTVMFLPEYKRGRLRQGITTNIVGYCGPTPAPYDGEKSDLLHSMYYSLTDTGLTFPWTWKTMEEYFAALESSGMGSNVASFVGHGTLRTLAMGHENRAPSQKELDTMKGLLADSLDAGAMGLALGLSYVPGIYSDTRELEALAKVVEEKGAMVAAHRRDEGNAAVEAVEEVLEVARHTGVRMHICHLKAMGRRNWGKTIPILEQIDDMRRRGNDIRFDVYPYVAGFINLHYIFPGWVQSGSKEDLLKRLDDPGTRSRIVDECHDPDKMARSLYTYATAEGITICACGEPSYLYRTLADIAQERGEDPIVCAIELIRQSDDKTVMICRVQSEEELSSIIRHPLSMICSDGAPTRDGKQHPRYMGAFVRVLDHYTKQTGLLTPEQAVRKMTGAPAEYFSLKGRGLIQEGCWADLVLLDWAALRDNAAYQTPCAGADGIRMTVLNGEIVAENGGETGVCSGRMLRRNDRE